MLLNEYFTVMTEILFKYEGTIDKYIGDAIMAFWNAPTQQEAHAQLSVEAALEMDLAIKELAKSFIARGWPGPHSRWPPPRARHFCHLPPRCGA